MTSIDLAPMEDGELDELRREVLTEQERRRRAAEGPQRVDRAIREFQQATRTEHVDGSPWEQKFTAAEAYMKDAVVMFGGHLWRSTHTGNFGKPGVSGWHREAETGPDGAIIWPPYIQPAGAHDAYKIGDRITWTDGTVRQATRSGVVHTPAEHPPSWEIVEDGSVPDQTPEPGPPEAPEWAVGTAYRAGNLVTFEGKRYRVRQNHTVHDPGHTPPILAALYELMP